MKKCLWLAHAKQSLEFHDGVQVAINFDFARHERHHWVQFTAGHGFVIGGSHFDGSCWTIGRTFLDVAGTIGYGHGPGTTAINGETIKVTTSGGDIEAGALNGPVKLTTSGGDIELGAVRGPEVYVTDLVLEDARDLKRGLGHGDRQKFEEYFESIRTIETQMSRLEKMRSELAKVGFEEPPEAYLPRGEYIRLMGDLMVVALQTGLTNVATFMVGPERWDTPFMYESLFDNPRSHHQMSHNQTKMIDDLLKVDRFHMEQFAYLMRKMDAIEQGDGNSLLDHTLFTYGSGLGDGSTHQYNDLPIIVAGGGDRVRSGKHINMPEGTPLANLWLTQAQLMGLEIDQFADSNGTVDPLTS